MVGFSCKGQCQNPCLMSDLGGKLLNISMLKHTSCECSPEGSASTERGSNTALAQRLDLLVTQTVPGPNSLLEVGLPPFLFKNDLGHSPGTRIARFSLLSLKKTQF